ncbi:unnamed protein product, partial [marine sediment metagenome]
MKGYITHYNNKKKTSLNLFIYLNSIDSQSYNTEIDKRRLRNALSQLVKEGIIEKSKGNDKYWYFNIQILQFSLN